VVTQTWIPTSAVAVVIPLEFLFVESRLVLEKSPVTNEGVTFNVTPVPLDVLIVELIKPQGDPGGVELVGTGHVGPVKTPVPEVIAHAGVMAVELKLPLDWAKASPDPSTVVSPANTRTDANFVI
jgi:hypothetical protein